MGEFPEGEFEIIDQFDEPSFSGLKSILRESGDASDDWPGVKLQAIGQSGIYSWFVEPHLGGSHWSKGDIARGYIELASSCLATTFIVTQRVAALRRIAISKNEALRDRLLPEILGGEKAATVGISHLTTSRRHLSKPVLSAEAVEGGFLVDGFSPWVTGGNGADYFVMGAELENGTQILFAIKKDVKGITVEKGFDLVALTQTHTGVVRCDQVMVPADWVLAGPLENVLSTTGVSTGSVQTSALALGLSKSAIDFLYSESAKRPDLMEVFGALNEQFETLKEKLVQTANGVLNCSNEEIRKEANSLVLRATQSALVAAKGTGFVTGHAVGRWCQEALFFLVWSCPQAVQDANLCEFAGIEI